MLDFLDTVVSLLPYLLVWMILKPVIQSVLESGVLGAWWGRSRLEEDAPRDILQQAVRDVIRACRTNGTSARVLQIGGDEDADTRPIKRLGGVVPAGYVSYVAYRYGILGRWRLLVVPQRFATSWRGQTLVVDGRGVQIVRGIAYVLPPRHSAWYDDPARYMAWLHDRAWEPLVVSYLSQSIEDEGATGVLRGMGDRRRALAGSAPEAEMSVESSTEESG